MTFCMFVRVAACRVGEGLRRRLGAQGGWTAASSSARRYMLVSPVSACTCMPWLVAHIRVQGKGRRLHTCMLYVPSGTHSLILTSTISCALLPAKHHQLNIASRQRHQLYIASRQRYHHYTAFCQRHLSTGRPGLLPARKKPSTVSRSISSENGPANSFSPCLPWPAASAPLALYIPSCLQPEHLCSCCCSISKLAPSGPHCFSC